MDHRPSFFTVKSVVFVVEVILVEPIATVTNANLVWTKACLEDTNALPRRSNHNVRSAQRYSLRVGVQCVNFRAGMQFILSVLSSICANKSTIDARYV